jgi:hypothetical protein
MPKAEWASEKKDLKSTDAKRFLYAANLLLLQRRPQLTDLVRAVEKRIYKVALDKKAKPEIRIDAIKALVTLGSDAKELAPLLESEKRPDVLEAVAKMIGGPDGSVANERATSALIARFEKPGDWSPQYDAIIALKYFADPRTTAALRAALKHPQSAVQREAINGLGHQRNVDAIPELVAFLRSTNPQLVAAAARALVAIGAASALAPLADKKHYAHAMKLAKDKISGRFGVRALQWFTLPAVDDDLLALATSEDGEVASAATDGLVHRRAAHQLAPLAKRLLTTNVDTGYYGRFFLLLLTGIAAALEKPPAPALAELATVLAAVKPEVFEQLLGNSDQLRYRLDRLDTASQKRVATWREAIGAKLRDAKIRGLVTELMTSPSAA